MAEPTLRPWEPILCVKYHCSLKASVCETRQTATKRLGNHGDRPQFEYCGSGACEQGHKIRAQLHGETYRPPAPVIALPVIQTPVQRVTVAAPRIEVPELVDILDGLPASVFSITADQVDLEDCTLSLPMARHGLLAAWGRAGARPRGRPTALRRGELARMAREVEPVMLAPAVAELLAAKVRQLVAAANDYVRAHGEEDDMVKVTEKRAPVLAEPEKTRDQLFEELEGLVKKLRLEHGLSTLKVNEAGEVSAEVVRRETIKLSAA